ncbi:MAG: FAD-binding oxidoreductase [bacterium]
MNENIIKALENIVGEKWVDTDVERVLSYGGEHTMKMCSASPKPAEDCVVVKPKNAEEISEILKYANENLVPVVPKGGGTGLAANGIPLDPSIILVLERINKKIEIDDVNLMVTCDTAVTLGDLIEKMNEHNKLYFPLHPGDEGAQVGGMAIMNAGGVRAVRDGIMRDQIRGLKVVLPTGEITTFGNKTGKLIKNNAGYDLMQLMIGSEGTLGVVTEVTLDLKPEPSQSATLVVPFEKRSDAFAAVPKILQEGIIPMAIEYMDRDQILLTADDLGKEWPAKEGEGDLMIILSEDSEDDLYETAGALEGICEDSNSITTYFAETTKEQNDLLEIRSHFLPALEDKVVDGLDITVPRSELNNIMIEIDKLSEKYDINIPIISHASDGNLHPFIIKRDAASDEIPDYYESLKNDIYKQTIKLGGTITGEHGIGYMRKKQLLLQCSEKDIELMKGIKKVFDPNNILNPKKIIDID